MAQGKGPDATSLALLSAWSGLNPADFTSLANKYASEPLALVSAQLRRDRRLSSEAADALDEMIKATYRRVAKD
jgi:LAS superfamily LD-carboxypeptidase LdcB